MATSTNYFVKKKLERNYLAEAHISTRGHKAAKSRITIIF